MKQTKNNLPKFKIVQINPGDYVYVKRDQSAAAKTDHSISIGPFKVLTVRDCVIEILKDNNSKDYVHRVHVCLKINCQNNLIDKLKLPEPAKNDLYSDPNTLPEQTQNNNTFPLRPIRNRVQTKNFQTTPKLKSYK